MFVLFCGVSVVVFVVVVGLSVSMCFQVCVVAVIVFVSFWCFLFFLFFFFFVCFFVFGPRKKCSFHFNVGGGRVKL